MKKFFLLSCFYIIAMTIVCAVLSSCGTSRNVGNSYQKHLSHKHSGGHYLNTNNRGCGWSNN